MKRYGVLNIKKIPKNINNINQKHRIYLAFLIFDDCTYFYPKMNAKILLIKEIFAKLKQNVNIKQIRYILADLISHYKIDDIKIAIHIKSSLNKQYRIYKKIFKKIQKNQIISGYDLLNLGIDKMQIKQIKQELLIYSIVNKIKDRNVLIKKAIKLNLH